MAVDFKELVEQELSEDLRGYSKFYRLEWRDDDLVLVYNPIKDIDVDVYKFWSEKEIPSCAVEDVKAQVINAVKMLNEVSSLAGHIKRGWLVRVFYNKVYLSTHMYDLTYKQARAMGKIACLKRNLNITLDNAKCKAAEIPVEEVHVELIAGPDILEIEIGSPKQLMFDF